MILTKFKSPLSISNQVGDNVHSFLDPKSKVKNKPPTRLPRFGGHKISDPSSGHSVSGRTTK